MNLDPPPERTRVLLGIAGTHCFSDMAVYMMRSAALQLLKTIATLNAQTCPAVGLMTHRASVLANADPITGRPSAPQELPKMQLVPFRNLILQHFHAALFHPIARMLILIVLSVFGI